MSKRFITKVTPQEMKNNLESKARVEKKEKKQVVIPNSSKRSQVLAKGPMKNNAPF
jgi:hypothetical protein